jgi:hypothetical protein
VRVSPQIESVVHRCMAKRADDRYSTMNDVLSALKVASGRSGQQTLTGQHAAVPRQSHVTLSSGQTVVETSYDVDVGEDDFSGSGTGQGPRRPQVTSTGTNSAAPVFARAAKSSSSAAPLFLAALFALTGIGGFIVLTQPFETAEPDKSLVIAGQPVAPAPAPVAEVKPAIDPNKRLVLTLRSTPSGATVYVDSKEYGPTPTHVVWTGADAADGREVTFRFRKRGFQDLTVTQTIHGDRLQVEPPPLEPMVRKSRGFNSESNAAPKPDQDESQNR